MAIDGKAAIRYVQDAPLPDLGGRDIKEIDLPPVSFDPAKDQAWVVGPQLFSFVQGVTAERREMIATSALFASLVADAESSRDKRKQWYDAYAKALTQVGWTLQEGAKRTFSHEHAGSRVHQAVLEFIAALGVAGTTLAVITAALTAMQKVDKDKPWITLFDRQTRQQKITGFQIGLVDQKAEGNFEVRLINFDLKLSQTHTQVLFVDFSTLGVQMTASANTVTVTDAVLKQAMPALQKRLVDYMKTYVTEVKLPPIK